MLKSVFFFLEQLRSGLTKHISWQRGRKRQADSRGTQEQTWQRTISTWAAERGSQAASGRWLNDPISRLFVRQPAAVYEDWYRSAWLALLDHQMDWYYSPSLDEDKVTVMILNTRACQKRKIIWCRWLWERFTDCHVNLLGRCRAIWCWCWKPEFAQRNLKCRLNYRPGLVDVTAYSFIMINTRTRTDTK